MTGEVNANMNGVRRVLFTTLITVVLAVIIQFRHTQLVSGSSVNDDDDYIEASGDRDISFTDNTKDDEDLTNGSGDMNPTSLCQRQELEASASSRSSSEVVYYVPQCTTAGQFKEKQCSTMKEQMLECWCVNEHGHQIPSTRAQADKPLDCSAVRNKIPINTQNATVILARPATTDAVKPINGGITRQTKAKNKTPSDGSIEIDEINIDSSELDEEARSVISGDSPSVQSVQHSNQPGLLAGVVGGVLLCLLLAVLLVMFIVYRMRKKDEGSYTLEEPHSPPVTLGYTKANDREFFA